ncbi:MAG: hypothetical protein M1118_03995 [Chloroflexi bacterium]|nr:hypothetical protein [Chloroflexota bacterium]
MNGIRRWLRAWLEVEPARPLPPPVPPAPAGPEIALETIKAIADLAAREYANDNDVQKGLDTKTATWIGATGAVLLFAIGTLGKLPAAGTLPGWGRIGYEIAYVAILGFALSFLVAAEVCFITAFRTRIYRFMNVQSWATYDSARLPPVEAYIELAGEYNRTINENRDIGARKARFQRRGVERCFLPALCCLLLVLVLNLVATW